MGKYGPGGKILMFSLFSMKFPLFAFKDSVSLMSSVCGVSYQDFTQRWGVPSQSVWRERIVTNKSTFFYGNVSVVLRQTEKM